MWYDSFIHDITHSGVIRLIYTQYDSFIWMSRITYACEICFTYINLGRKKYRSLLQNIVSFIGLFCDRDLKFIWMRDMYLGVQQCSALAEHLALSCAIHASHHIWIRHITYEFVRCIWMCYTAPRWQGTWPSPVLWMSHITYEWVASHINAS